MTKNLSHIAYSTSQTTQNRESHHLFWIRVIEIDKTYFFSECWWQWVSVVAVEEQEGAVDEGDGEEEREEGRRRMAWKGGGERRAIEKNK